MTDYSNDLYEKYLEEQKETAPGSGMTSAEFQEKVLSSLTDAERVETDDPAFGKGVMYYSLWDADNYQVCSVPVCGYYASSEKALSMLFSRLAEQVLEKGTTLFQIRLYANDIKAQRLFSMMQFGFMAEKGILDLNEFPGRTDLPRKIRTLSKDEISDNWDSVWKLTHGIIRHLQQAPVFYPGTEFTEDVYKGFYLDENTNAHAMFSEDGEMTGMIETNSDSDWFCPGKSVNIGESFLLPRYRGTGASEALLQYAAEFEKKRGAEYLWVEHGTANPNARGFWNRYFKTYQYEMNRLIEKI